MLRKPHGGAQVGAFGVSGAASRQIARGLRRLVVEEFPVDPSPPVHVASGVAFRVCCKVTTPSEVVSSWRAEMLFRGGQR